MLTERNALSGQILDDFRLLGHGHAFASERSFLYLEACALDDAAVGRDGIACFEKHHIAGNQLFALDEPYHAVTKHLALRSAHGLKRFNGLLRLAFLQHAQYRVKKHDRNYDYSVRKALLFIEGDDCGDDCGNDENDYHRILELLKETLYQRGLFRIPELVTAVPLKPFRCLSGGKTGVAALQLVQHILSAVGVKFHIDSFPILLSQG